MKIERLTHSPGMVADFYEEALSALGALCERTWHDRVEIVAAGESARLWNESGTLHEVELWFPPPEDTAPREAATEVFPGCPLTFRLAEALRPSPLVLDRVVLTSDNGGKPPTAEVAEKLWRAQFPETNRWKIASSFVAAWHFSLLALLRCEIQAIDQHWSLQRVAVSLPDGVSDDPLAQSLDLAQASADTDREIKWPPTELMLWRQFLRAAVEEDLAFDLATIRERQAEHLRRELDRIDHYFEHYEQELTARAIHSGNEKTKLKSAERLAAAKAEHSRRRADQVARHEIHTRVHFEALLLTAESAWQADLHVEIAHEPTKLSARFVPRARRWIVAEAANRQSLSQVGNDE